MNNSKILPRRDANAADFKDKVSTTGVELEDVDDSWYDENGGLKYE